MSTFQLAIRNLLYKPWGTALSLLLAMLGAGLISLLLLVSWQFDQQLSRNLAGVNLIIGAKGSPLQLVMSSLYHVQYPTGNIPIQGILPYLNPDHPYIEQAIPLSLGDSYEGYRIVGTRPAFLTLYGGQIAQGRIWKAPMEAVVGARVAETLGLAIGATFQGSHGLAADSLLIHEDSPPFIVVGILAPTGSVADQLLLTSNESTWLVHDEHQHDEQQQGNGEHQDARQDQHEHEHANEDAHEHAHEDHHHHDHDHDHDHDHGDQAAKIPLGDLTAYPTKDITSLLLRFKGNSVFSLNLQRGINENTGMLAASPSYEIDSLYATMGPGEAILSRLAAIIVLVSILSIFISLYTSLDERRRELALIRSLGGSRNTLLGLLLTEGVILAFGGALLGLLLSHLGLYFIARFVSEQYRYDFAAFFVLPSELYLLLTALLIGLLAAAIPALRAANTDVHQTLSGSH